MTSCSSFGIRSQLMDAHSGELVMDFKYRIMPVVTCVGALMLHFRIEGDASSTHALNIVSPGWTCSEPFAEHLVADARKRYDDV